MSKQSLKYAAFAAGALSLVLIVAGLILFQRGTFSPAEFSKDVLVIQSQNGKKHRFHIEIAETPSQLARGLMERDSLASDAGMLFIYPASQEILMWMHNTKIPLDMLFIDQAGVITRIAENNRPYDNRKVSSHGLALAVLEINGGLAARFGIRPGDTVQNARLTRAMGF